MGAGMMNEKAMKHAAAGSAWAVIAFDQTPQTSL
jgi:hypothetical protein